MTLLLLTTTNKTKYINSPFACKDLGMQLEIIARDVTTGCSGCLYKYIEFNGNKTTKCFKLPAVRSIYGIDYINE